MSRKDKFLRKCIACGGFFDKESLVKITKNHENGKIVHNINNEVYGRSMYVCKNSKCIDLAFNKSKISKILHSEIDLNLKENIKTVLE